MKAAVLGDGGWGTALAMVLQRNGHDVTVWGPFEDYIQEIQSTGINNKYLAGVPLPQSITFTSEHEKAVKDAELIVLSSPSKFYTDVAASFADLIRPDQPVVSVAKGLSKDGHKRMSEMAEEILQHPSIAVLSGPSHAEEVARGVPTAVVIACRDHDVATHLQQAFNAPSFRVYSLDDVVGVELGGALKNVIAIAAGVCDGLGYGDNTKAALITRGLAEMVRLGKAWNAQPSTFSGLSGLGDLIVTCSSKLSRNRGVGERLGKGETTESILSDMAQVAEGVWTCSSASHMAHDKGIDVPITFEVQAIVHEGKDPGEAVKALLARDPKPEGI